MPENARKETTFNVIVRPQTDVAGAAPGAARNEPRQLGNPEVVYAHVVELFTHYLGWRHRLLVGFFTFVAANGAAFATIKTKDLLRSVQWTIPFCVSAGAMLFWGLEVRNRELYRSCTRAGEKLESLLGVNSEGVFATLSNSPARPPITHSDLFDIMFFVSAFTSSALGIIAAWSAEVQLPLRVAAYFAFGMVHVLASLLWFHVISGMEKPQSKISSGTIFLALAAVLVGISWMSGFSGEIVAFLRELHFSSAESVAINRVYFFLIRGAECELATLFFLACGLGWIAPSFLLSKSGLVRTYAIGVTLVTTVLLVVAGERHSTFAFMLSVAFWVCALLFVGKTKKGARWQVGEDAELGARSFDHKFIALLFCLCLAASAIAVLGVGWTSIATLLFPGPKVPIAGFSVE